MKFFDLFAGIGGFRLGMEKAGHICVGACEIDEQCRKTYYNNFGHYPEYDDVRKIMPKELPDFDVLCAGFPCQSFSYSGKRRGFDDTRGTLYFDIIRIAREKRPQYIFLENVRGLLSNNKGKTFKTILESLDELGYNAEWCVLNSANFVPQERERIYILAYIREKSNEI